LSSQGDSIRIPVFDHSLPHQILFEELQAQGKAAPGDEVAMKAAQQAYAQLVAAKDALDDWSTSHPGTPTKGSPDEKEQNDLIEKVRQAERNCQVCDEKFTDALHRAERSALCFSGGGIRSASICLGVLQALARFSTRDRTKQQGTLYKISFLSTVSGGGYIGSWLMAWARRHPLGYKSVVDEISKSGITGVDPEPRAIRHLREYTSFLAPRLGGLTVDTWTLLATVVRNLFLNNCMLLPVFAALLCLPILASSVMCHWAAKLQAWPETYWLAAFAVPLSVALLMLAFVQSVSKRWDWNRRAEFLLFLSNATISLVVAGLVVYWLASPQHRFSLGNLPTFAPFIAIPLLVPAFYGGRLAIGKNQAQPWKRIREYWRFLFAVPVVAIATSALLLLLAQMAIYLRAAFANLPNFARNWKGTDLWPASASVYVLGLPLVWAILLTASSLFTGIVAESDSEENREWWARMKAIHMLLMLGWFVASLVAFYGPILVNWIFASLTVIVGAIAAYIAKSPKTPAQPGGVSTSNLDVIAPAIGLLFLILLAITLAHINRWAMRSFDNGWEWFLYFLGLVGFAVFCNFFFSVNVFSLHGMYRSRLIRAYLGASNESRTPDFFTNFDQDDNLPEAELPKDASAPLHIINATLNLVATTNTAWTQRKAESFTFSPMHCGSFRVGYVPTKQYAGTKGITLGTAMAISGAAFNPNMGYHSSPLLTLIMTLFNARLGYWLPNPKLKKGTRFFRLSSPQFALGPLLNEALGRTNDTGRYVQLSDGAHFENLALYEMVMRRCRRIIVVDGGADPKFEFEDLGNAIRKIRIDLGIPIEFKSQNHIKTGNNPQAAYCAMASISYKDVDGGHVKDGELIYFKPAVRGSESIDVQNYATAHKDFPHETTADQFFNEAQFESYRKLGVTMVEAVLERAVPSIPTIEEFFQAARVYCAPQTSIPASTQEVVSDMKTFLKSGKMHVTLGSP